MNFNSIKARFALRSWTFGLLFFILSLGLYNILRPAGFFAAFLGSALFLSVCIYVSAYISAALELWEFKKLADVDKTGLEEDGHGELAPEVKEVRDAMRSLLDRMDEAVLSQKRFLADASHEIRSPITVMKGNIEIALRRERDVKEYKGVLESNLEEIDRLEYLVRDLMFLARADANELVMNMAPTRLDEVLEKVVDGLMPLAAAKGIQLELDCKLREDSVMEGDAERLRQLFVNLVENALRYTQGGGKVGVELDGFSGVNSVVVSDTGIGIPQSELGRIFDRFYRVDKARSRHSGGTGLGLCICKWIVEAHGGDIYIESTEGVGTKVRVMFISTFS